MVKKIHSYFIIFYIATTTLISNSQNLKVTNRFKNSMESVVIASKGSSVNLTRKIKRLPGVSIIETEDHVQIRIRQYNDRLTKDYNYGFNYTKYEPSFILNGILFKGEYKTLYNIMINKTIKSLRILSRAEVLRNGYRESKGIIEIITK